MNWLNTILILAVAWLAIFLEATFSGVRNLIGAQIDLLPGLMVYAGLTRGLGALALIAVASGLGFDAMSANPFGVSVLPLFLIGWLVHFKRQLILREEFFAQLMLGLGASAIAPVMVLLLIQASGLQPLVGWGTLWQWLVMSAVGGMITPFYFLLFGRIQRALNYEPVSEGGYQPNREIKRGRS